MAGLPSGGQTLTPNPNVNAPAGIGGDLWGANGGGITPIGGGIGGPTGYAKPLAIQMSDAEQTANLATNPPQSMIADQAVGARDSSVYLATGFAIPGIAIPGNAVPSLTMLNYEG
jgi:hypothetical protein